MAVACYCAEWSDWADQFTAHQAAAVLAALDADPPTLQRRGA